MKHRECDLPHTHITPLPSLKSTFSSWCTCPTCLRPTTELKRIEQLMIVGRQTRTISSKLNPTIPEAMSPASARTSWNENMFAEASQSATVAMVAPVSPAVPTRKNAKRIPFGTPNMDSGILLGIASFARFIICKLLAVVHKTIGRNLEHFPRSRWIHRAPFSGSTTGSCYSSEFLMVTPPKVSFCLGLHICKDTGIDFRDIQNLDRIGLP
jgi:hypothetical protein